MTPLLVTCQCWSPSREHVYGSATNNLIIISGCSYGKKIWRSSTTRAAPHRSAQTTCLSRLATQECPHISAKPRRVSLKEHAPARCHHGPCIQRCMASLAALKLGQTAVFILHLFDRLIPLPRLSQR